jgi:hypothetical protein
MGHQGLSSHLLAHAELTAIFSEVVGKPAANIERS